MNFTPAVYEHAARLIGVTPWQASRDQNLMIQGHAAAFRRYHHVPVVAGIDIYNLEPEALGAVIEEPAGNGIPSIKAHPCGAVDEIPELTPFDPRRDGRIPMVIEAAQILKEQLPEAQVKVPVSGPFTLASNLTGFDNLLCDCLTDPERVAAALEFLIKNQAAFIEAVHRAGLGVTTFESAATPPLLSPDLFRAIVLPALKKFLNAAADVLGEHIPCIIGGNAAPILDALMETEPGYVICPSETDQAEFMRKMEAWPDVMVRINMNPGLITGGAEDALQAEMDRVLALAASREKVCIGTGVLPYEADPETVDAIARYIAQRAAE